MKWRVRNRVVEFPRKPMVMGIINLGSDSFSGDGLPDMDAALDAAGRMIAEGAEIIDVGAESARTNREVISEKEETEKLVAFVKQFPQINPLGQALLSINTWRPPVVESVLVEGGDILNDIGGLPTDANAKLCARYGASLLIMHSIGEPKIPHTHVQYRDVLDEMENFFEKKIQMACDAGLSQEAIIIDPGIDFAKQRDDNLRIYRELERFKKFNRPILLPVSRKTVIGDVLEISEASQRDAGTVACVVAGRLRGASIFRVHNVKAAVQALRITDAVLSAE